MGVSEKITEPADSEGLYNIHPLTLNFLSAPQEKKFRQNYFQKSQKFVRVALVTVLLLVAAFGIFDFLVVEQYLEEFLFARYAIALPFLTVILIISLTPVFRHIWQELLAASFIVVGFVIIWMLLKNPWNMLYYGGLFLVFMAGYSFIKLRFLPALVAGAIVLLAYSITSFADFYESVYSEYMFLSNAFFYAASVIGLFALYNTEQLERDNFRQNCLLLEQRDKIASANRELESTVSSRTAQLMRRNRELVKEIAKRRNAEKELLVARDRAEESDRLKTAFLANMSHEIRTPMNGILGFAGLLEKPELNDEKRRHYLDIIRESGKRMLNIINDLIDISKIEAGLTEVERRKTVVNDELDALWEFFRDEASAKGVDLKRDYELERGESIIFTDTRKFVQIMTNLLKNAVKFTTAGTINFGYCVKNGFLEFYVKDTGDGIAPKYQGIIFDRFVRAEMANSRHVEGAGLGLPICKAFVTLLGGTIWFRSAEGVGSDFRFTLPLISPDEPCGDKRTGTGESRRQDRK